MSRLRSAGRDALWVVSGQAASYAYPLLAVPLLSRMLGPAQLGQVMVVLAVVQLLLLVVDFGFGYSALRQAALARTSAALQLVVSETLGAKLALWLAGSAVMMLAVSLLPVGAAPQWFAVGAAAALGAVFNPTWLLQALGRLPLLAVVTAASRLAALAGLLVTVSRGGGPAWAVWWQYAPYPLAAIASWSFLARSGQARLGIAAPRDCWRAVRDGTALFVNAAGVSVIANVGACALGVVSTSSQVAFYGAADRMGNAVRGLLSAALQSALPRLARSRAGGGGGDTADGSGSAEGSGSRLILGAGAASFGVCGAVLAASAGWLVPWYLGRAFDAAIPTARLLGIALMAAGVSSTIGIALIARGGGRENAVITTAGAVIHIVLAPLGALRWGANGAAGALIATETLVAASFAIVWLRWIPHTARHRRGRAATPARPPSLPGPRHRLAREPGR